MQIAEFTQFIREKADNLKARNLTVLDIREKSDVADFLVIGTGTSKTHVHSIAEYVATEAKHAEHPPLGIEGGKDAEWVLVDFGSVVTHFMTESAREFYQLEKLWGHP